MLLQYDGYDEHGYDDEDGLAADMESTYQALITQGKRMDRFPSINADFMRRGCQAMHTVATEVEGGFHQFRDALIVHMMSVKERGQLMWLKKCQARV